MCADGLAYARPCSAQCTGAIVTAAWVTRVRSLCAHALARVLFHWGTRSFLAMRVRLLRGGVAHVKRVRLRKRTTTLCQRQLKSASRAHTRCPYAHEPAFRGSPRRRCPRVAGQYRKGTAALTCGCLRAVRGAVHASRSCVWDLQRDALELRKLLELCGERRELVRCEEQVGEGLEVSDEVLQRAARELVVRDVEGDQVLEVAELNRKRGYLVGADDELLEALHGAHRHREFCELVLREVELLDGRKVGHLRRDRGEIVRREHDRLEARVVRAYVDDLQGSPCRMGHHVCACVRVCVCVCT